MMWNSGRLTSVAVWFERVTVETGERHPWLAVLAAQLYALMGDATAAERWADIAERGTFNAIPAGVPMLFPSSLLRLRSVMCRGERRTRSPTRSARRGWQRPI